MILKNIHVVTCSVSVDSESRLVYPKLDVDCIFRWTDIKS